MISLLVCKYDYVISSKPLFRHTWVAKGCKNHLVLPTFRATLVAKEVKESRNTTKNHGIHRDHRSWCRSHYQFLCRLCNLGCKTGVTWAFEWFLQLSLQPKIHVYLVTWVMWPSIFSVFSKIARQKTTQPWWPLLPSYYYAATSNRDMAGGEHHHQRPCYAILVDDLLPPSWLSHKNTHRK